MAITVGCSDFNEPCEFRIIADDGEQDMLVDLATPHAMKAHPEFASEESQFREAIRAQIKSLMLQSHTFASDVVEHS